MKLLLLATFVLAACSGPQAKPESALVNDGSAVPENCCCKFTPIASVDGLPLYETHNPMECSSKQGTCVPDVQCDTTEPQ